MNIGGTQTISIQTLELRPRCNNTKIESRKRKRKITPLRSHQFQCKLPVAAFTAANSQWIGGSRSIAISILIPAKNLMSIVTSASAFPPEEESRLSNVSLHPPPDRFFPGGLLQIPQLPFAFSHSKIRPGYFLSIGLGAIQRRLFLLIPTNNSTWFRYGGSMAYLIYQIAIESSYCVSSQGISCII